MFTNSPRAVRALRHRKGWTRAVLGGRIGVSRELISRIELGDTRTARSVIARHDALFGRFNMRGRAALAWLRRPHGATPAGLLWFVSRQRLKGW